MSGPRVTPRMKAATNPHDSVTRRRRFVERDRGVNDALPF